MIKQDIQHLQWKLYERIDELHSKKLVPWNTAERTVALTVDQENILKLQRMLVMDELGFLNEMITNVKEILERNPEHDNEV